MQQSKTAQRKKHFNTQRATFQGLRKLFIPKTETKAHRKEFIRIKSEEHLVILKPLLEVSAEADCRDGLKYVET